MKKHPAASSGAIPASPVASALLDELVVSYGDVLGEDYEAYGNHCRRVFNFCLALAGGDREAEDKIAVTAVFHDLGIWTDGTFDYLAPSQRLARKFLAETGRNAWLDEIAAMIGEHHKLTPYVPNPSWLVEPFRKADLIDLSGGLVRFRLPDDFVVEVLETYPGAGFHKRLLSFALKRFRSHPFNPLPMLKL